MVANARATISTPIRSWRSEAKQTGKLKWHYQFTPHDVHDWDAEEPPVLVDTNWQGQPRKLLLQANRNGFFYVLDRTNGQLLLGKQILKKLNWAEPTIGKDGRPVMKNLPKDANGDTYVCPGFQGGANWYSTSFNPATGFYYFSALERCNNFSPRHGEWQAGRGYMGFEQPGRLPANLSKNSCVRLISRRVRSPSMSRRSPRRRRRRLA